MIPYKDENPTDLTPVITIGIIVVNALVWLLVQGAGVDGAVLVRSVCELGLIPGEVLRTVPPGTAVPVGPGMRCLVTAQPHWWTVATSMFLHAGWLHIIGNMVFLFVFGIHVERSMGGIRYAIFYLLCGLGASALEIATSAGSNLPGLGASGAISGVLAGYLVMYPTSHVRTLIPLGFFFWTARLPAWVFIGFWFLLQVVEGLASLNSVSSGGGVAYSAHVGGFVTGLLLVRLFAHSTRVASMRVYHGS